MTEAELQSAVIELAHRFNWRVAHFRPGMNQRGRWMTAVQGDGAGFPDLVCLRDGRIIVAELKAKGRKPTPEQDAWLDAFRECGAEVAVFRPADWESGLIERALRGPPRVSAGSAERAPKASTSETTNLGDARSAVARSAGRQR